MFYFKLAFSTQKYPDGQVLKSADVSFTTKTTKTSEVLKVIRIWTFCFSYVLNSGAYFSSFFDFKIGDYTPKPTPGSNPEVWESFFLGLFFVFPSVSLGVCKFDLQKPWTSYRKRAQKHWKPNAKPATTCRPGQYVSQWTNKKQDVRDNELKANFL